LRYGEESNDPEAYFFKLPEDGRPRVTSMRTLPNGKVVNLGFYLSPYDEDEREDPRLEAKPAPVAEILRPVSIERVGQLLFLFVNDVYIDIWLAPGRPEDGIKLSERQQARIDEALCLSM
jgi:hypothetical protein